MAGVRINPGAWAPLFSALHSLLPPRGSQRERRIPAGLQPAPEPSLGSRLKVKGGRPRALLPSERQLQLRPPNTLFPSGLSLSPFWLEEGEVGSSLGTGLSTSTSPLFLGPPSGQSPLPRLGKRWAWSSRDPEGANPLPSGERVPPPYHVVEQGLGAPHSLPSNSRLCGFQFPPFPPRLGVVHLVSYHVSECVWGGSVLISMAGGFSFHASLPPACPGATRLALPHAGVIGGGGWGSRCPVVLKFLFLHM